MKRPYVAKKTSRQTGQTRYTGMYYDATGTPRSAGTYDAEAEALAAAQREQKRKPDALGGRLSPAQKHAMTFDEFWPLFRRHHRVEPNTMQEYHSTWRNHIRPFLRSAHVSDFDAFDAITYFTNLAENGRSVTSRRSARRTLSAMLGLSVTMGFREDNPVRGLNVGKQAANKTIKVINETVFWELCKQLPLETQRLFSEYIFSTGVRYCEAISLEEGDLDYETCMLTVCRSTVEVSREFHPTGGRFYTRQYTKNGEHRRMKIGRPLAEKIRAHVQKHGMKKGDLVFPVRLFMPDTAWVNKPRCSEEEIEQARKYTFISPFTGRRVAHGRLSTYTRHKCRCAACVQNYRDWRSAARVRAMARKGKVTRQRVRRDGNDHIAPSEWSKIWLAARRVIGIDITPYQLRHSHASLLLANGVPLPEVQARLGHNDLTSTTRYVWALSEESDAAANVINQVLGYAPVPAREQETLARLTTLLERLETVIDPTLAWHLTQEQTASGQDLHVLRDTLSAMESRLPR
ncbi:tyrosine-type recombinase/integrase [Actinomadura oligospora]|uniref:tyrosine-type recombinase/integrase n=1 Tax=Actinomadura oligospora TaxID=111804 RepID=UPI0004B0ADC8|nr:tyrosine-type recombinase/integrase [Actinomadura oligospora]